MAKESPTFNAQNRGWRTLRSLHPAIIDLQRVSRIREKSPEELARAENIEQLLLELGLNNEGMDEYPAVLHRFCGGLRIWQYPSQFSRYLAHLSRLKVCSYLEIGIRHGGSFVATVEILERFFPIALALGVDILPAPSMAEYSALNGRAEFVCINTQSTDFADLIQRLQPIDLVFIDSHHEESQCRREFALVRDGANMIAFHDIANVNCPGVAAVWREVTNNDEYRCYEYVEQYEGMGPFMGIGLAIRKERLHSWMVNAVKEILGRIKGRPEIATELSHTADIVNDVGLDSLEMLRFMLELEERLLIQIDFDTLEYSYFSSIETLAGFLETMPLQQASSTT